MNLSKTVEKSGRLDENVSSFQRHGSRSLFPHAAEPVKATLRRAQRRRAIRVPFESQFESPIRTLDRQSEPEYAAESAYLMSCL